MQIPIYDFNFPHPKASVKQEWNWRERNNFLDDKSWGIDHNGMTFHHLHEIWSIKIQFWNENQKVLHKCLLHFIN